MKRLKTDISQNKQKAFVLLSDVGGLLFLFSLAVYMFSGAEGLATVAISAFFLLTLLSAAMVLIGFIRLLFQKSKAKDRLPTNGLLVFGASAGGLLSLASVITDCVVHYESGVCFAAWIAMCVGCVTCVVFGLPAIKTGPKSQE